MENDVPGAVQRFERAGDQVLATLTENLDENVVGDAVLVDEPAAKIEFDLRSRRETDLDFLEADFNEQLEIFEFLLDAHRLGERLIAVAEIDAAPNRSASERSIRPLSIGQMDRREWAEFGNGSGLHDAKYSG
jgi:hypothetical protein